MLNERCFSVGVVALVLSLLSPQPADALPPSILRDQYHYSMKRRELVDNDFNTAFYANVVLNDNELIADAYLDYLVRKDENRLKMAGQAFPPAAYFTRVKPLLHDSPLYKFLRKMPKGGNLHLHSGSAADRTFLLAKYYKHRNLYVWPHPDSVQYIYGQLGFYTYPPSGWVPASQAMTLSQLQDMCTMRNFSMGPFGPTLDSEDPWRAFFKAYNRFNGLINFDPAYRDWYQRILEKHLEDGVQYIELRGGGGGRYILVNSTQDGGQRKVDPTGLADLRLQMQIASEFVLKHPFKFFGMKVILTTMRTQTRLQMKHTMLNALNMSQLLPDFIIGFDMAGEEDAGQPLVYFLDSFNALYHSMEQLSQSRGHDINLPFFFHSGESNWESTSSWPDGFVKPVTNLYDSLLLGSKRIGHGTSLIKRPSLFQSYIKQNISIEICPISNQMLGYVSDLRTHPAVTYMRSGLQCVLASDDPGLFDQVDLSYDYYLATLAWDLDLYAIKQLVNNSLIYSGMPNHDKLMAMKFVKHLWDGFINETVAEACAMQINTTKRFLSFLPNVAPLNMQSLVSIFGEGFESAVCQNVRCRFGNFHDTFAVYNDATWLDCVTPFVDDPGLHPLSLSFDDGATYMDTGLEFHFADIGPKPLHFLEWYKVASLILGVFIGLLLFGACLGGLRSLRKGPLLP